MATRTPKPKTTAKKSATTTAKTSDSAETPTPAVSQLKLKELVETVVERTGQRKGEARTAIQAALAVMGEALADGTEVNLPPLGKMKINRTKETPRGQMMMIKLVQNRRAPHTDAPEKEPLAQPVQEV